MPPQDEDAAGIAASRTQRATAGRRLTQLVGEALDADESFWNHGTWDSDRESFHSSDQDSELLQDEFDSDFDDSESEEEEAGDGNTVGAAEQELRKLERADARSQKNKALKTGYKRKLPPGMIKPKRIMGDGLNAGLVLGVPGTTSKAADTTSTAAATTSVPSPLHPPPLIKSNSSIASSSSTTAAIRPRRQQHNNKYASRFRAARADSVAAAATTTTATVDATTAASSAKRPAKTSLSSSATSAGLEIGTKQRKRTRHSQHELLLESVHETEPNNHRWLLSRQRQAQHDEQQELLQKLTTTPSHIPAGYHLVERHQSRRGALNTISFFDMDRVPDILAHAASSSSLSPAHNKTTTTTPAAPPPKTVKCVITGQPAKYRDPKTGRTYANIDAFRELRRRWAAGEIKAVALDKKKMRKPRPPKKNKEGSGSSTTNATTVPTPDSANTKPESSASVNAKRRATNGHAPVAEPATGEKSDMVQTTEAAQPSDFANSINADPTPFSGVVDSANAAAPVTTSAGVQSEPQDGSGTKSAIAYSTSAPGTPSPSLRTLPASTAEARAAIPKSPPPGGRLSPRRSSPRRRTPSSKVRENLHQLDLGGGAVPNGDGGDTAVDATTNGATTSATKGTETSGNATSN